MTSGHADSTPPVRASESDRSPTADAPSPSERFAASQMSTYGPLPILPDIATGSRLVDTSGTSYIDLTGGIAVNLLGHCHPALVGALTEQGNRLWHLSNVFTNEPALQLAERLTANTFADRVFFSNSGAEANEAALKLARRHAWNRWVATQPTDEPDPSDFTKYGIVSLELSFHGRTFFTVSTGGNSTYRTGFGPTPAGIGHVPPNDIDALTNAVGPDTAAVILEPIVAEGGIITLDPNFLVAARSLCDTHDALLIFDEVQTGLHRTGPLYAYMTAGQNGASVRPDIITSAKGLGGGFPIGATLASARVAESFERGTHGSTFGGNPLACSVANAVLDTVSDPALQAAAAERSDQLRTGLETIGNKTGLFEEVRGRGMLLGAALAKAHRGRAKEFQLAALEHGVLALLAGPDVTRLTPALNLTEDEAAEGLDGLAKAAAELAGKTTSQ